MEKVCFGVNGEFCKGDFSGMVSAVSDMSRAMGSAEAYIEFLESENARLNEEVERLQKDLDNGRDMPELLRGIWEERYPQYEDAESFASALGSELEELDNMRTNMESIAGFVGDVESALEDLDYYLDDAVTAANTAARYREDAIDALQEIQSYC